MDRPSRVQSEQLTHIGTFPDVYSAYIWKNVSFTFWFGPATLECCAPFEEGCRQRIADHPEGLSAINVMVPGSSKLPEPEARAELARIIRDNSPFTSAVAMVIPGTGFWASALRAMIATLSMMRPRSLPMQVFGNADELVEWLAPLHTERTGVPLEAAELLAVYNELERMVTASKAA